jgi:acetyl-CoA synthetase
MSSDFKLGSEIVWYPSEDVIEKSNLTSFLRQNQLASFDELMERSQTDVAWFTNALINFLEIEFYQPYKHIMDLSEGLPWPKWCVGGKLNIIHNCLDKHLGTSKADEPALIWEGEGGNSSTLTYAELSAQVNKAANALHQLGIGAGDAVGVYMPMIPECVVATLAIAKIGAIILPLFSGYGASALITRLEDLQAKALFTADGYFRRGQIVDMKANADKAFKEVASLRHQIILRYAENSIQMQAERDHWWHEIVEPQSAQCETERTAAEDVLMVIYTSGTTGKPKGAVHTHCGFPIKAAQDMAFGTDVHPDDLIYWMTDMGWMMGPWLVLGALLLGATFFIYDGAPDFPGPDRLWEMVERHKITILGLSPTLVRALIPHGEAQFSSKDLTSLRAFASTGEPWNPDPWMWLFDRVGGRKIPIINYSGGTEISGGIVMGNPILPLKPTAFSAPCPGIAADVFNEHGESVIGQVGELVIKAPWIGMTRGFWNDPDRYRETYWSRWTDVWVHGDFAAVDEDGLWYILGRSDDTIKIAGKRLGPAEVESIIVEHSAVIEAAAIGLPHEIKGSELALFCVLVPGVVGSDELRSELIQAVAQAMGRALAPRLIVFVSDLPKTRNAKVMRRMIRASYLGQDPGDLSALVNPEILEEINRLAA